MVTADAFLHDICANPGDDTPRLVFADWLDDNGDPRRAEFIRLQCRLAGLDEFDPQRPDLIDREWELLTVYRQHWRPPPSSPLAAHLRETGFVRGFFAKASLPAGALLEHGEALFREAPIEDLRVRDLGRRLPELAAGPWLAGVVSLNLSHNALTTDELRALLDSPYLGRLRRLGLQSVALTPDGLELLLRWAGLRRLQSLDLGSDLRPDKAALLNQPGPGWLQRLLESPLAEGLTDLNLWGRPENELAFLSGARLPALTHLRLAGCPALDFWSAGNAEGLPALRHLNLGWSARDDEGNAALLGSPLLARLDSLDLSSTRFGPLAAGVLARSPHLSRLRRLNLTQCRVGPEEAQGIGAARFGALMDLNLFSCEIGTAGLAALADSPHLANLTRLELMSNRVGAEGAKLLADSALTNLRWLGLARNWIGPDGAKALASATNLSRLRHLSLWINDVGARGARALLLSPNLAGLWSLDLYDSNLTDATAKAVASSTPLAELRQLGVGDCRGLTEVGKLALASSPRLPRLLFLGHDLMRRETEIWPVSDVILEQGKGREL